MATAGLCPEYIAIHQAIHDPELPEVVDISGTHYPIHRTGGGLRYADFRGIRFMIQNKHKDSRYGARARAGEKITWGIREGSSWIEISDDTITAFNNSQAGQYEHSTKHTGSGAGLGNQVPEQADLPPGRVYGHGDYRATRGFWGQKH